MTAGTVRLARLVAVAAPIAILAGCGGSGPKTPSLDQLPLLPGAKVVTQAKQCDRGTNGYCALELVVVDPHYKTSDELVAAEHRWVYKAGWRGVTGDTGAQNAAESPSHKLRVTYGAAYGDLTSIDLGYIHRARAIAYALSRALFDHSSAMSVMVEIGSG